MNLPESQSLNGLQKRGNINCRRINGANYDEKRVLCAIIERDEEWYIAFCPEIPEAIGQGASKDEARESLAEAIALVLRKICRNLSVPDIRRS